MADHDGSPRRTPPVPSSRAEPRERAPGSNATDASSAAETMASIERAHRRRASALDALRDGQDAVPPYDARDAELARLRLALAETRDENDALGEAVLAMKAALVDAGAAESAAPNSDAERSAAEAERSAAAEAERSAAEAERSRLEAEARDARVSLVEVERLALELRDDLTEAERLRDLAQRAAADAASTAAKADDETRAAKAALAEAKAAALSAQRDAEAERAKRRVADGLEAALAEAKAAALSATRDRDAMAASWRKEWESAKEDHAGELRALRARIAAAEADAAEARGRVEEARGARDALERALGEAMRRERASRRDQNGAAESLRVMAEHEDAVRASTRGRDELVARLRADAADAAARCEHVAQHCAELLRERDAAVRRAERAEDRADRADLDRADLDLDREPAPTEADGTVGSSPDSSASRGGPSPSPAGALDALFRAAVRGGKRSPTSFSAGMRGLRTPAPAEARGGGVHTPSASGSGSSGSSGSPSPRGGGWMRAVDEGVAEELVRALAREIAASRDREARGRARLAEAREERDDARRALLAESRRNRELERMRVADLAEVSAAEQRARAATSAAWGLRDRLALALAQKHVERWESEAAAGEAEGPRERTERAPPEVKRGGEAAAKEAGRKRGVPAAAGPDRPPPKTAENEEDEEEEEEDEGGDDGDDAEEEDDEGGDDGDDAESDLGPVTPGGPSPPGFPAGRLAYLAARTPPTPLPRATAFSAM